MMRRAAKGGVQPVEACPHRIPGSGPRLPRAATRILGGLVLGALALAPGSRAAELLDGRLHLYGHLEARAATWLESSPIEPLQIPGISEDPDHHLLSVLRMTFQVEADWQLGARTEAHAVFRAAWEPRYAVDRYASRGSHFGEWRLPRHEYNDPDSTAEMLREVWLRHEPAPGHALRAGRQIVNWGESLAFRVTDVINPNDSRTSLFFLDAQDSRIAQWMLRGLHEFPAQRGTPALEWIVIPPLDPEERRANDLAPTGSRFAVPSEKRRSRYPFFRDRDLAALWTLQRAVANGGAVDFRFLDEEERDFPPGWRLGARAQVTLGPVGLAAFLWHGYTLNPVVEDRGLSPFVIADYAGVLGRPDLQRVYTALGIPEAAQAGIRLNRFAFRYPRQTVVGLTGNAYLARLRAVTRFEVAWRPNRVFQIDGFDRMTGAVHDADGLVEADELAWQMALDFGGLYWPRLNRQGDFTFNLEYTQRIVLAHDGEMRTSVYETRLRRLTDTLSVRASTVYGHDTLRPSLLLIWQLRQAAWAGVAALGFTAPWDEKLTAELRVVAIGGRSHFAGLGLFRRKDFAMLAVRYEF